MGSLLSRIFAALYDSLSADVEAAIFGDLRRSVLRGASGRVLEVGAGTGENLSHYAALVAEAAAMPSDGATASSGNADAAAAAATAATGPPLRPYTRLVMVEPNPHMRSRLHTKLDALSRQEPTLGSAIEVVDAGLPSLPFPDGAFDTVVLFLVLCSVADADVAAAVAEVRRVLAPTGKVLVIEHLAATADSAAAHRQARWATPWRVLFDGCRLQRESVAALAAGGFDVGGVVDRTWHMNPFEDLWLARVGVGTAVVRAGGKGGVEEEGSTST
ncbi:hypothetical protein MMPV_000465 [Pyropia vietnamensis]